MLLFTFDSALSLIKRILSIDETDFDYIEYSGQSLQTYSGLINTTQIFYRPYYVIALALWTDLSNNLISGEGAKFDQNIETTRRYLIIQERLDRASSVLLNPEFECSKLLQTISNENVSITAVNVGFISF
jgi:hypothetical protein